MQRARGLVGNIVVHFTMQKDDPLPKKAAGKPVRSEVATGRCSAVDLRHVCALPRRPPQLAGIVTDQTNPPSMAKARTLGRYIVPCRCTMANNHSASEALRVP